MTFRAAVLLVVTGVLLTGCGTSVPRDTSTPVPAGSTESGPPVVIETPAESATDTPTATATVTRSSTRPAGKPPISAAACTARSLRVAARPASGGDSHAGLVLVYTNTGQIACSMAAYPGVVILNAAGKQIIQAVRTPSGYLGGIRNGRAPFPAVLLQAGDSASALLEGQVVDTEGRACPVQHALLTIPPATTGPVRVAATIRFCGQVQIHPIVAGSTGSKP